MYNNVGVLVDGRAEDLFFRATLPGCKIRRIIPNGRDVPLELIVEAVKIGHESFCGETSVAIVKIDREQRKESCDDILSSLNDMIESSGITRPTIVALPDRCLENWILADDARISALCGTDYDYIHEGQMGKPILNNILGGGAKIPYVKTSKLLISASAQSIRTKSSSFSKFATDVIFDWDWLER